MADKLVESSSQKDKLKALNESLKVEERPKVKPSTKKLSKLKQERRGLGFQKAKRKKEALVNKTVWEVISEAKNLMGLKVKTLAQKLNTPRSSLYYFKPTTNGEEKSLKPLGRPQERSSVSDRNFLIDILNSQGYGTSVRALKEECPNVAYREIKNVVKRFRLVKRIRRKRWAYKLSWHEPLSVWAMDHAEPPKTVDGKYEAIFTVRDLGSGSQLLWSPVKSFGAKESIDWLEATIAQHGAPLVLKQDNGPAFISKEMAEFFKRHQIEPMFSPVRKPSYNGSCEASVGAMKTRTHEVAFEAGRPGKWKAEDLEVALNRSQFQHPLKEEIPDSRSNDRREKFRNSVLKFKSELELVYKFDELEVVDKNLQRLVQRQATHRALIEHGILSTRRG